MDEREGLRRLQGALADALVAGEPECLARAAAELPEDLRRALAHVDRVGLRLAALLVARLRFERLIQGSRRAAAWFDRDARAFTAEFRRYHREVAPTAGEPWGEATAFEHWLDACGGNGQRAP